MSVFINNIDDFIIPSQGCINPLISNKINNNNTTTTTNKIKLISDYTITDYELNQIIGSIFKHILPNQPISTGSINT